MKALARFVSKCALAVAVSTTAAVADTTLMVQGAIADPSSEVALDVAALEALPIVSFQTGTIWTDSELTFSGPTLAAVLELVGAAPGKVRLSAANDYEAEIPASLITSNAPIIATRINGKPFSVRDHGPLWVVFPYDRGAEFRTEPIYTASVWQLIKITITPE